MLYFFIGKPCIFRGRYNNGVPSVVVIGLDGSDKWAINSDYKNEGSSFCVLDSKTYLYNSYFNGNIDGYTTSTPIQPTLTISATAKNAVATATTASITFTTNNTWTASSNAAWLKVSPASGNAGTNLAISFAIDANTASTARTGVITFTAGGLTQTFTVTQAGTIAQLKAKGTPLHDATVVGDTVGDPFKDTSSVALNPIIKFTTLFGLLAVELGVQLTKQQGASFALAVSLTCLAISAFFVHRSFYGMRIKSDG